MTDRIKWGDPVTGLDGVIAVARAMRKGTPVQTLVGATWREMGAGGGLYASCTYRIGEDVIPREFWVNLYPEVATASVGYASRELADAGAVSNRIGCIRVREVIE